MNKNHGSEKIVGILLAGGVSRRLGYPKQLLKVGGVSLIRRGVLTLLEAKMSPVVVLGAFYEEIKKEVEDLGVQLCYNSLWEQGMGTSVKIGVKTAQETSPDALVIMVCDQLAVDAAHLNRLQAKYKKERATMVASSYGNVQGVPALFDKKWFKALIDCKGDKGARDIIRSCDPQELGLVPLAEGEANINTFEDLKRISKR